jgi:hypothetical protein
MHTPLRPLALAALALAGCGGEIPVDGQDPTFTEEGLSYSKLDLENLSPWHTCGNCANTGATGGVAYTTFTTSGGFPNEDGSSGRFTIGEGGAHGAYDDAYWWYQHPALTFQAAAVDYELDVYVPAGSAPQAIEFEVQQVRKGYVYNFGWQANYVSHQWRIFDYAKKQWQDSGIPFGGFPTDRWHHIVARYRSDGTTHAIHHDTLAVDGDTRAVVSNGLHVAPYKGGGDQLTNALQLDLNGSGAPFHVYFDRVQVAIGDGSAPPPPPPTGCSAPSVLEPTAGQSVGPAIDLRVSAPSCLGALKAYLDGNPTPVASSSTSSFPSPLWIPVALGGHTISVNGWDASGKAYLSAPVSFTRTY